MTLASYSKQAFCLVTLALPGLMFAQTATPSPIAYQPFTMDHRRGAESHSPVDVSFLLDAPAGKHGFLHVSGGHLADDTGARVRLWGVNVTDWSKGSTMIPSREDAPMWAATLARFGVNCVRLQFLDLPAPRGLVDGSRGDTRSLDAAQFDREDFFLAELEKRGIYLDINLLVGRPFRKADGVADASSLGEGAKGTSMFDKRLIELQKEYARELLNHRNPYTGRTYARDPAVAIVEINNENAIDVGYHAPSPYYADELARMYNAWLPEHATADQLGRIRQQAHLDPLAPVPLMQSYAETDNKPSPRFYAEANFYNDLEKAYFTEMQAYLQSVLGVRSLLIATADHNHKSSGYPIELASSAQDVMDGHTYWQHPEMHARPAPMVDDPYNSTVAELARSALAGKAYTVSETNNPFPSDYAGEAIPILAAYGGFQDWDAIFWYTFEPKSDPHWQPYIGDPFDISLDPVKMPELAAGALLFLRGDVERAHQVLTRQYSKEQVFASLLLPAADRPFFTPGFSPATPFEHEVRIATLEDKASAPALETLNAKGLPLLSDTGQLAWTMQRPAGGMVRVEAPRVNALIGFVSAYNEPAGVLSAAVENRFCTLMLISLEDQPIAGATHLLLVAGGPVRNTGQGSAGGSDARAWGTAPTMVEPVTGTVTLLHLPAARRITVQPLDGAGQPLSHAIDAVPAPAGGWSFHVGEPVTTWYSIVIAH